MHPPEKHINIYSDNDLIDELKGHVFHATTPENANKIKEDGYIVSNQKGEKSSPFGNYNGYFRLKECVSFFDYRKTDSDEWKYHYYKCRPIEISSTNTDSGNICIFVLCSSQYHHLIPWSCWKEEKAYRQTVVPYIEAGIKSYVPLSYISLHIWVTDFRQPHPLEKLLPRT